jgi:hypothetical protein
MGGKCVHLPPAGWTMHSGHCYRFLADGQSWQSANGACQGQSGYLAIVGDLAENSFLLSLATLDFWIGCNDLAKENDWRWLDGSALAYDNWWPGEPNNWAGNEDCGHVFGPSGISPGHWNDAVCTKLLAAVCERD